MGDCLNDLSILRVLSQQPHENLSLAEHKPTGRQVLVYSGDNNSSIAKQASILRDMNGTPGFTRFIKASKQNNKYILITEVLGKDMFTQFMDCKKKFTMKTVLMIAEQMIQRLKDLHQKGYTHSNIQPNNIRMGLEKNNNVLYLYDFSHAHQYLDPIDRTHKVPRYGIERGFDPFASINQNMGTSPSRRDDMESLGYTLIYLLKGTLPWKSLIEMREMAMNELTAELPPAFAEYITQVRELSFDAIPEYDRYLEMFDQTYTELGLKRDFLFDWNMKTAISFNFNKKVRTIPKNFPIQSQSKDQAGRANAQSERFKQITPQTSEISTQHRKQMANQNIVHSLIKAVNKKGISV